MIWSIIEKICIEDCIVYVREVDVAISVYHKDVQTGFRPRWNDVSLKYPI